MKENVQTAWTADTLRSRIASGKRRYEACSPNPAEAEAYARGLEGMGSRRDALVMGMTPEVRRVAAAHFDTIRSVDINPAAIELYRDWLPPELAAKERVDRLDWNSAMAEPAGVDAVLGDGCLPNLPPEAQQRLLAAIFRHLRPGGRFITRQPCIPESLRTGHDLYPELVARFRSGELDADAFGAGLRLKGFLMSLWDAETGRLDNAAVFARLDAMAQEGLLTGAEYAIANRFRFSGPNWIFTREKWELMLVDAGFSFERRELRGRDWYPYYAPYYCFKR